VRKPVKYEEAVELITGMFGAHNWSGADSHVWRIGRMVVKVTLLTQEELQNQRILSRQLEAPIARIIDIKVVGCNPRSYKPYITLMVQEYVSGGEFVEYPYFEGTCYQPCDKTSSAPREWNVGTITWFQTDAHMWNAVKGRWVDTARIFSRRNDKVPATAV